MNNIWVLFLGIWTSISVFSQSNFYDNLHGNHQQSVQSKAFDFEQNADSLNAEITPLSLNEKNKNIPVYQQPTIDKQSALNKK